MNSDENSTIIGYDPLVNFTNWYRGFHGWVSAFVCIIGIPCNLLNILVLTRPNMISSPTNLILTALAVSDLFTMFSNLPNSVYFYIINDPNESESIERDKLPWISYQMMHVAVSVTSHSISIWLTVYLAFFRYIFLVSSSPNNINKKKSNQKNRFLNSFRKNMAIKFENFMKKCRTYKYTVISIINICIFCVLFCIPSYMYPAIRAKNKLDTNTNITHMIYHIGISDLEVASNGTVYQVMFYSQVSSLIYIIFLKQNFFYT